MGPSSQGRWRFIGNHRLRQDRRIKRDSFLKETEELRQVYNLQFIQVTERKVLLNCKLPIARTKGRGTQACIHLPFVLAIGNRQFNKTLCSVNLLSANYIPDLTLVFP